MKTKYSGLFTLNPGELSFRPTSKPLHNSPRWQKTKRSSPTWTFCFCLLIHPALLSTLSISQQVGLYWLPPGSPAPWLGNRTDCRTRELGGERNRVPSFSVRVGSCPISSLQATLFGSCLSYKLSFHSSGTLLCSYPFSPRRNVSLLCWQSSIALRSSVVSLTPVHPFVVNSVNFIKLSWVTLYMLSDPSQGPDWLTSFQLLVEAWRQISHVNIWNQNKKTGGTSLTSVV